MRAAEADLRQASSPALIFMHIPKTAGSTLNYIIERHFSPQNSFGTSMTFLHPEGTLDAFMELEPAQKARIRLLNGHMGFGLHEQLPGPAVYVTVLRDPIERVISQYCFECEEPQSPIHSHLRSGELDIKGFVRYYAEAGDMDNLQTRIISGNWHKRGYGPCTKEILEQAKENLRRHFALVGLTERFDETYLLLRRRFGWRHTLYIKHNRTRKRLEREAFSPEDVETIRQYNLYDVQLYEYVQTLFSQQVSAQGRSFAAELKLFQACNRLYALYWKARRFSPRRFWRRRFSPASAVQRERAFRS